MIRVEHRREAEVSAATLWTAARSVTLGDTRALGRLIRVRIPGLSPEIGFDELFRSPPFYVLDERDGALVSGLVGRIWTLRRDYPALAEPEAFRHWSTRGTVRVMFATWVEPLGSGAAALVSETRIDAVDRRARLGLAAVRPLIVSSNGLVGSDGLDVAVRRARGAEGR